MTAEEFLKQQGVDFNSIHSQSETDDNKLVIELMQDFARLKCKEQRELCASQIYRSDSNDIHKLILEAKQPEV